MPTKMRNLDEESKKYLTINTHRGLFAYNRLVFGLSSSPLIFQRIMDNLLKGLPGCICYLDDILVTGVNEQDHLDNLNNVFNVLQKSGIKLNKSKSKCEFFYDSVEYLGHVI